MSTALSRKTFYGWHVVAAVFVLTTFGWGLSFYGPPVSSLLFGSRQSACLGSRARRLPSPAALAPLYAEASAAGRDWRFLTLATGMTLGLFAQIGLLAHLFSLLVPALGAQLAGVAAGAATASAIVGRRCSDS
jgi:hypothetical protein